MTFSHFGRRSTLEESVSILLDRGEHDFLVVFHLSAKEIQIDMPFAVDYSRRKNYIQIISVFFPESTHMNTTESATLVSGEVDNGFLKEEPLVRFPLHPQIEKYCK